MAATSLILVAANIFGESKHFDDGRIPIRTENIVLGKSKNTTLPVINSRGIGYYYTSFYSGVGCSGTPTYQEGYATGKCLRLGSPTGLSAPSGTSIRMDCSATRKDCISHRFCSAKFLIFFPFSLLFFGSGWSSSAILFRLYNLYWCLYYHGLSRRIVNGWQLLSPPEHLSVTSIAIVQSWFGFIQTDVYVYYTEHRWCPR